jgi:hypothetical protein
MTRIETTATIGADRNLTLQLPDDVPPGTHRFVVLVDDEVDQPNAAGPPASQDDFLEWEGNVLVFTGKLLCDPMKTLDDLREERDLRNLYGPWE